MNNHEQHFCKDRQTCECKPIETTCSAVGVRGAGTGSDLANLGVHKVAQAPKYIGLSCVILVALAMVLTLYYLVAKRRDQRTGMIGVCNPSDGLDTGFRHELPKNLQSVVRSSFVSLNNTDKMKRYEFDPG